MFFKTNRPWREQDVHYAELETSCPSQRSKTCDDFPGVIGIGYLATGFYTVDRTVEAMKQSLLSDGPFYFRYDVYDDFYHYWSQGTSLDNYVHPPEVCSADTLSCSSVGMMPVTPGCLRTAGGQTPARTRTEPSGYTTTVMLMI